MNHEIICRYCGQDQRLYGLTCCQEYMNAEDARFEKEYQKRKTLKDILHKHNIFSQTTESGGISIPEYEVEKLIKLLGG